MTVSPARAAAFHILMRIERDDSYADELLNSDSLSNLSGRDHGLTTELVMGVLRWRSLLDELVSASSSQTLDRLDLEVLSALRLGAYQLHFLSRVPARAAIFESVELVKVAKKKSASSFVNAVLRKIAKQPVEDHRKVIEDASDVASLAQSAAHPEWMVARWEQRYGLKAAQTICLHNQSVPVTTIRLRWRDDLNEAADSRLATEGVRLSPGELVSSARRVLEGDITNTASFREGRVSIQDEGAQLVGLLAAPPGSNDGRILDCCAAPGSKTSLMANRNPQSHVFAVELHQHRARLLRRLNRESNVSIVVADAQALPFAGNLKRILADVPCSGTGTLGHNPEIKWRLRRQSLESLQAKQIAILKSAMGQLAVGGRVLYSTCSIESEENEDVVKAACAGSAEFSVCEVRPELDRLNASGELAASAGAFLSSLIEGPYLKLLPGIHHCDGFFAALIERREAS